MHLQSLHVSGFKTFATPTRIEFAEGITAVVGSNGSGKSNLVDALRWALGEQSMRDLRSRRAEDVIFAGSQRRRAAAMAEARLVFDNGARWLSIDTNEVEFVRRLYRSGESEYLINGRKVRLRDITSAIRDAGMAGSGHTIVGQGMVDSVLSARGIERRAFISTVAGVAPYDARRNEALHRLELTKQNIASGQIVLDELEPRIRLLRRQSNIAQSALAARSELRQALHWYYWSQWTALSRDRKDAQEAADGARRTEGNLRARLTEVEGRHRLRQSALDTIRRRRQDVREKLLSAQYAAQRSRDLCTAAHDGLKRQQQRLLDLERQLRNMPEDVEDEGLIAEQERAIARLLEEQNVIRLDIAVWQDKRTHITRAAGELLEGSRRIGSVIQRLEHEVEQHDKVVHRLEREIEQIGLDITKLSESLPSLQTAIETSREDLEQAKAARAAAEKSLEHARAALEHATEMSQQARVAVGEATTTREEIVRSRESAIREQAELLRSRPPRDGEMRVVQSITVPDDLGPAVAVALGEMTEQSSRPGPGEPGPRPSPPPESSWRQIVWDVLAGHGMIPRGWLSDLVHIGDPGAPVIHRLSAVLVMQSGQDLEAAWHCVAALDALTVGHAPLRLVDPNGDLRSATARRSAPAAASESVHRQMRLAAVTSRLVELEKQLADAQDILGAAREAEKISSDSLKHADDMFREANLSLATAAAKERQLEHDLQAADARRDTAVAQLEGTRLRAASLSERREAAERVLSELRDRLGADREHHSSIAKQLQDVQSQLETAEERIRTGAVDANLLDRRFQLESAERDRLRRRLTDAQQDRMRLAEQLQEARTVRDAFELERQQAEESLARSEGELKAAEHELDQTPGEINLPDAGTNLDDLPALHRQIEEAVRERERSRLEQEQIEEALNFLSQEALLDLDVSLASLTVPDMDREFTDVEIRRLRIRAEQAEDIDPGVTQEYEASVSRRDIMVAQIDDLQTAMTELTDMLREADREVRRRFQMAFSRVNGLFSVYFREIFGGGTAELTLESADEVESVEIVTQLPGKRPRELGGLSGGERTLVAGAFLFALIAAAPPPFCILDEVDAALDETNVDRYVGVLKDLSRSTQFIVVTHNRGTMAAANSLYGIVLDQEAGSRALSLRLDEAVIQAGA